MRIDSSGNLLVGKTAQGLANIGFEASSAGATQLTRSGAAPLTANRLTSDGDIVSFRKDGTTVGSIGSNATGGTPVLDISTNSTSGIMRMLTSGSERMRIDSSGNLLVGTTATPSTLANTGSAAGFGFDGGSNYLVVSRSAAHPLNLNRLTNDGDIAVFRKDGTIVGSIGVNSGYVRIGTDDTNLLMHSSIDTIVPHSGSANRDAAISLGYSGSRFKDLYLSGGAYLGGTVAANLLDDYEAGTWTPVIAGQTTTGTGTYTDQDGLYTKVGNLVTVTCYLNWTAHTGTGLMLITGLPFTASSLVAIYPAVVYASGINAGTSATQLLAYATSSNIAFRGFVNNATRADTLVNTSGQLAVTISYRAA